MKNFISCLAILPILSVFSGHGKVLSPDVVSKDYEYLISSHDRHQKLLTSHQCGEGYDQYAAGSIGGLRNWMSKRGLTLTADYLQYFLGDPLGEKRGVAQIAQFSADLDWDLSYVWSTKGLRFHVGALLVSGSQLENKVGTDFALTLLYGGRTFLVGNIYLEQTALGNRLRFKFGRIMAGDDFASSSYFSDFLSLAFVSQIALYENTPMSGYPYAVWGVFMGYKLKNEIGFKLGIYAADFNSFANHYHGLDLSFTPKNGSQLIGEINVPWRISKKRFGQIKAGSYYFSGAFNTFASGEKSGNYGSYLILEQNLYKSNRGTKEISGFLSGFIFQRDRNKFSNYATVGLVAQGLLFNRKKDKTSLGFAKGWYSGDLRRSLSLEEPIKRYEILVETNHWFQIKPFFRVTPAVQYVIKPTGEKRKSALVLNLQADLAF